MAEPDYKNNLDDFKANCQAIVKMITNGEWLDPRGNRNPQLSRAVEGLISHKLQYELDINRLLRGMLPAYQPHRRLTSRKCVVGGLIACH